MWRFLHLSCCTSGKIFCRMKKKVYFCKQKSDDNIEKKRILLQEKLNSGKYGKSVETVGWGNRYIWF